MNVYFKYLFHHREDKYPNYICVQIYKISMCKVCFQQYYLSVKKKKRKEQIVPFAEYFNMLNSTID